MSNSLELRAPFVDWVVFEDMLPLIVSTPSINKTDVAAGGMSKFPADITQGAKTDFEISVFDWMAENKMATVDRRLRGCACFVYESYGASLHP